MQSGEEKDRGLKMIQSGDWGTTLETSEDMNFSRWLMIRRLFFYYRRQYKRYFTHKEELK